MKFMKGLKRVLKLMMPHWMFTIAKEVYTKIMIYKWKRNGAHVPPPHIVKQMTIREYQNRYHYNVLVETGTYLGEMVEAQKKRFNRIFSIELGVDLYKKAIARFKNDKNVTILLGDSGKVLNKVLLKIAEPAIFWLDGHYSAGITAKGKKECPILEELAAIFSGRKFNHILLIDDARCFIGKGDYPTIDQLTDYIKSKNENYRVEVKYDIVRYVI
jgi:hypothetical protein